MFKEYILVLILLFTFTLPASAGMTIEGEIRTIFDKAYYGDDEEAIANIWANEEILDLNLYNYYGETRITLEDVWNLPMNEEFKQEYEVQMSGQLAAETDFLFTVVTQNNFVETKRKGGGQDHPDPPRQLHLDRASLNLSAENYDVQLGHIESLVADDYFLSGKGLEGMDLERKLFGLDFRFFGGGYNPDRLYNVVDEENENEDEKEIYQRDPHYDRDFIGLTLGKELADTYIEGKYYFINSNELVNMVLALQQEFSPSLSGEFEVVHNSTNELYNSRIEELSGERSDLLVRADLDLEVGKADVNAQIKSIGQDFQLVYDDGLTPGRDELSLKINYPIRAIPTTSSFTVGQFEGEQDHAVGIGVLYQFNQWTTLKGKYELRERSDQFDSNALVVGEFIYPLYDNLKLNSHVVNSFDTAEESFFFAEGGLLYQVTEDIDFKFKLSYISRDGLAMDGNRGYIEHVIRF
ncbi:hypothetical protein [Natroniella sp. ANB-PHB2]|uniref:hypothetical protein n=1 Tax=Natroniella sp. ANB-PHB2 TaxID=3384444 RepID=UPI0038D3DB1E